MNRVLLFAGTSEGRQLAGELARLGAQFTVCVATPYGRDQMKDLPGAEILCGRQDEAAMEGLLARGYDLVIDATHPYAQLVTQNLQEACGRASVPLIRLVRPSFQADRCRLCHTLEEVVAALEETEGNVLLTTGSKDLAAYTRLSRWQERLFPRMLPDGEAIAKAMALGYERSHLICMQGPFSREMNVALIHQFSIRVLVTKDSGQAGGFAEKLQAAEETGTQVILLSRPLQETGMTLEETKQYLARQFVKEEE